MNNRCPRKLDARQYVFIYYYNSAWSGVGSTSVSGVVKNTTDWTRYVAESKVPPNAVYARVYLYHYAGGGDAYYDAVSVTPGSGVSTTAYDAATNTYAVSSNGPTDIATAAGYDARGRTIETSLTPRGGSQIAASKRVYDDLDRVESIAMLPDSGYGIDASFSYSDAGRLKTVTDPLERTATIAYDSAGRVTGVTSAEGIRSKTVYDRLGRVEATFAPADDATPTVTATEIEYDGLSRVASTEYHSPDGAPFATLTPSYDIASRVTGTVLSGEVTGTVSTEYDDLDRPADVTATGPAGTFGTQVTYDVADLPTNIIYTAFGQTVLTVANTYAKTNELVTKTAAGKTWSFSFAQGGALSTYWSDRTLKTRSLDVYGRLAAVRTGFKDPQDTYFDDLFESRVAYDSRDRVASTQMASTRSPLAEYTDEYDYDLADRLIGWDRTGDVQDGATYSWDAAGNLDALRRSGEETTTFTSDDDNRLTTAVTGSAVTTYTSDAYGRRTRALSSEEGTTTYAWDPLGHLTEIASADATSTYQYGISGMRERVTVETTAGVTWTESVWSGGELVAERDSDGTLLTYVWGPDRTPLSIKVASSVHPSGTYYYHTDAQGSVVAMTDESGDVVASYRYDAFGALAEGGEESWLAERNPLRYRSYYLDRETGLYYLPARYYEPTSARFLSPDPAPPVAGDPLSLNAYAYCQGDPVNASDPTGAIADVAAGAWTHYYSKFATTQLFGGPGDAVRRKAAYAAARQARHARSPRQAVIFWGANWGVGDAGRPKDPRHFEIAAFAMAADTGGFVYSGRTQQEWDHALGGSVPMGSLRYIGHSSGGSLVTNPRTSLDIGALPVDSMRTCSFIRLFACRTTESPGNAAYDMSAHFGVPVCGNRFRLMVGMDGSSHVTLGDGTSPSVGDTVDWLLTGGWDWVYGGGRYL